MSAGTSAFMRGLFQCFSSMLVLTYGKPLSTSSAQRSEVSFDSNTLPAMLEAVRAEATLGEICNAFKPLWGEYREPARF